MSSTELVLANGSRAGVRAPMADGYYMIGRHGECQIRPKSRSVSRHHCLLESRGGRLRIFDLNSTSGTRVNEERLHPRRWRTLESGDVIRCGKIQFEVHLDPDAAEVGTDDRTTSPDAMTGVAMGEADIAEFLSSSEDPAASDTDSDIESTQVFDADEFDFDSTVDEGLALFDESNDDPWAESEPTLPGHPDSIQRESSDRTQDHAVPAERAVKNGAPRKASADNQATGVSKKGKPRKRKAAKVPPIPKIKKTKSKSGGGFNGFSLPAMEGSALKAGVAAIFLLIALGVLGTQLASAVGGNQPRIVRGID